ncbi:MAG: hypothetical protein GY750_08020 [Lentisphaerae bacterium]|nr:hypothetical protein [Lentisphaerota bacterium]MCP4101354.1 hypothetical protein [Lentisphaerota bacterium]
MPSSRRNKFYRNGFRTNFYEDQEIVQSYDPQDGSKRLFVKDKYEFSKIFKEVFSRPELTKYQNSYFYKNRFRQPEKSLDTALRILKVSDAQSYKNYTDKYWIENYANGIKIREQSEEARNHKYSERPYTSTPVWACIIANYLFRRNVLQKYKAEEMMINQIKWQKNMAAGIKAKNINKIIASLESSKNVKSGYGLKLQYDDNDIVNYFMRDGMSIPGNANGFIKSSGWGREFVATADFLQIINPFSYANDLSFGNYVSVSLAATPIAKLGISGKYDKNPASFILQTATPTHSMVGLPQQNYIPSSFWKMQGCKIHKKLAGTFSLGAQATASLSIGASKDNGMISDIFDDYADYDAGAGLFAGAYLHLYAFDGACKYDVENQIFIGEKTAIFGNDLNVPAAQVIKNDVLNILHPYDLNKNRYYEQQKGVFDLFVAPKGLCIQNLKKHKAYLYLLTTDKGYKANVGKIRGKAKAGVAANSSLSCIRGDEKYFSNDIKYSKLGVDATLFDAKANAYIYKRKAYQKNRKARLFLPFKLDDGNSYHQCYYNQDTEILYSKEKSCSYLGFAAKLNVFGSLGLTYDPFNDDLDDDWKDLKERLTEEESFYDNRKSYIQGKTIEKSYHKTQEYYENSLMYTSINTIWREDGTKCEGSCFNVGKSTDITPITLFYEKYFKILALYGDYLRPNLRGTLSQSSPKLSNCMLNRMNYESLKETAKDILESATSEVPEISKELSNRKNKLYGYFKKQNRRSNGDLVLLNYSVKKFKEESANRFYQRRKTITAVDDALAKYWKHVIAFSIADVKGAKGIKIFKELNDRVGLLNTIIDECHTWMNKHSKTNTRYKAVKSLVRSCKISIFYYSGYKIKSGKNNMLFAKKSRNSIEFCLLLECEKLLTLTNALNGMFESMRISRELGLKYILPETEAAHKQYLWGKGDNRLKRIYTGSAHKKHPGIIGLIYDLVEHENIKAVIFETVFDLNHGFVFNPQKGIFYRRQDEHKDFKDIKLPNIKLLEGCSDKTNIGIRLIYRKEDSFENRRYIFQLGTRLMPVQSREKLDINLSFSYQHQQSAFTGISLYSASNPKWQDHDDPQQNKINQYMKTILIS